MPMGTMNTAVMLQALCEKAMRRNKRTPGAQMPWWAKKPVLVGAGSVAEVLGANALGMRTVLVFMVMYFEAAVDWEPSLGEG
jgi:predicted HAD superfamily phosphohydrolase YqeG